MWQKEGPRDEWLAEVQDKKIVAARIVCLQCATWYTKPNTHLQAQQRKEAAAEQKDMARPMPPTKYESVRDIIRILQPGETLAKALNRLKNNKGAKLKRKSPAERAKEAAAAKKLRNKPKSSAAANDAAAAPTEGDEASFDKLTAAGSAALEHGFVSTYVWKREDFVDELADLLSTYSRVGAVVHCVRSIAFRAAHFWEGPAHA